MINFRIIFIPSIDYEPDLRFISKIVHTMKDALELALTLEDLLPDNLSGDGSSCAWVIEQEIDAQWGGS